MYNYEKYLRSYAENIEEISADTRTLERFYEGRHSSIWYNNKQGFKKESISVEPILNEDRIFELSKCASDIHYFVKNYLWIEARELNKNGSRTWRFNLRKYQKEQVDLYSKHKKVALLYPRRSGKTSGTIAYFLHKLLFQESFKIICYANKDSTAKEILKEIKKMLKFIPLWMQEGIKKMNEHTIEFENGSVIKAEATTKDAGRSSGANIIYLDEVAFVQSSVFDEFYGAVRGTATEATQFIATSTPYGLNHWWKICRGASTVDANGEITKEGKNGYVLKTIDWNEVPTGADPTILRGEKFKQEMIAERGIDFWLAEYEAEFVGSSGTLLSTKILKGFAPTEPISIVKFLKKQFPLKIYVKPIHGHRYIVTHDPASGHGNDRDDNTAIHVFDLTDPFQIVQSAVCYANNINPLSAPYLLEKICRMYNNAYEISERNKYESIPQTLISEIDYDNIYVDEGGLVGHYVTNSTRDTAISYMRSLFENGRILVNDYDFVHELSVFVSRRGKYQADEGEHDDLVTSFMLLSFMMSDEIKFERLFSDAVEFIDGYNDVGSDDSFTEITFDDGNGISIMSGEESWDDF